MKIGDAVTIDIVGEVTGVREWTQGRLLTTKKVYVVDFGKHGVAFVDADSLVPAPTEEGVGV